MASTTSYILHLTLYITFHVTQHVIVIYMVHQIVFFFNQALFVEVSEVDFEDTVCAEIYSVYRQLFNTLLAGLCWIAGVHNKLIEKTVHIVFIPS
jgi:hypothetical protein